MGCGRVAENSAVCAGGRSFSEDGFDIFDEAHAEHLVGFVENDGVDRAQVKGVLLDQVEQAPGCAHHDVYALF